jgi:hypothetical protein
MQVSAVIITRNDNFGGNMVEMGTACLQTMSKTFDEVILIDFGSIEPLYPIFNNTIEDKKGNIRVIHVPHDWITSIVHDTTTMADVIGRNIGIRRASYDIILSSNIDIIPAPKDEFDLNTFDENVFYTSGKYMIEQPMIVEFNSKGISWHEIQQHLFDTRSSYYRQPIFNGDPWSKMSGCGDFQMGHRNIWFHQEVRGFEESLIYKDYVDTNLHKKIIENAHKEVRVASDFHVFHQSHPNNRGKVKINNINVAAWNFTNTTNTENWGYPEETFEENTI